MPQRERINGVARYSSDGSVTNQQMPISKFDRISARAGARAPQQNGRQFNGRIKATNIPTQHARAGILKQAQEFSDKAHAGMIRVD